MSLVLKQDLKLVDSYAAHTLKLWAQSWGWRNSTGISWDRRLKKGTPLPEGPLHPIAALAFAMEGFVLTCEGRTATDFGWGWQDGGWRIGFKSSSGHWRFEQTEVIAPRNARIIGHRNPEVL